MEMETDRQLAYAVYQQAYDVYQQIYNAYIAYEQTYAVYEQANTAYKQIYSAYEQARAAYELNYNTNEQSYIILAQAYTIYEKAKQQAVEQEYTAWLDADKAAQQAYKFWETCLADHKHTFRILIPPPAKRRMLQDSSTPFMGLMKIFDHFEAFWHRFYSMLVGRLCYLPPLPHSSFSSLLNLAPFPMYCCQKDLQRSRRDVGELTVQEEPRKSKMRQRASKASIGDVRLLHYSLRAQNVGRLCMGMVGCLDRQERSAGYSTGFSPIPRIGKDHRKRRRKLSYVCQT
jgi:hypothetical protein